MIVKIRPDINPQIILKSRGLGKSSAATKVLAETVARLSDPYVPMDPGSNVHLKDGYTIASDGSSITYRGPYAHYQYVGEVYGPKVPIKEGGKVVGFYSKGLQRPTGKEIEYQGAPMRGKEWDKRMMADRGDEVTKAVADFVGGKPK